MERFCDFRTFTVGAEVAKKHQLSLGRNNDHRCKNAPGGQKPYKYLPASKIATENFRFFGPFFGHFLTLFFSRTHGAFPQNTSPIPGSIGIKILRLAELAQGRIPNAIIQLRFCQMGKKASGTQGCARTVPEFSTDRALRGLTSKFGRDPVYSPRYGRQRFLMVAEIRWVISDPALLHSLGGKKASGTQGCSRTVPQFSTDRALRRLTSEFGRDPVYSPRYGR